jgi:hypothetical protein
MASAKKCDRCFKFYDTVFTDDKYRIKEGRSEVDLCPECSKLLQDWMNMYRNKENEDYEDNDE